MLKGFIYNIQRFSLHDGPGIRTTIFFKGCPLQCWWCQNPESISRSYNLSKHPERCLGCGSCLAICREKALAIDRDGPVIDRHRCNLCLECATTCPAKALEAIGEEITLEALIEEALRDRFIFDDSGGGITLSGGEPLLQLDFLSALLEAFKKEGIATAVDTCGYASWPALSLAASLADLVLYDLKLVDSAKSRLYTGVPSIPIIENLEKLAAVKDRILVRFPVIPTITDERENLEAIAATLKRCGLKELELIPYHRYGRSKYDRLDLHYRPGEITPPAPEQLKEIVMFFENRGIKTSNGAD